MERSNLDHVVKAHSIQHKNIQEKPLTTEDNSKEPAPKKPLQPLLKPDPTMNLTPLSFNFLQELGVQLGGDGQNCLLGVSQVVKIESLHVLGAYNEIYRRFHTVPYFFCSWIKDTGYLWQINRLCPYKPASNAFVLDSKAENEQKCRHISLLMLAKITCEENERFVRADLFDDTQFMVRTTIGDDFIFRLYDVTSFVSSARVNPYQHEVISNNLYSYKLVMKKTIIEELQTFGIEITLWRNMSQDIEMKKADLDAKTIQDEDGLVTRVAYETPLAKDAWYPDIIKSKNGVILFIDHKISNIVMWRGEDILSFATKCHSEYLVLPEEDKIILIETPLTYYMRISGYFVPSNKIFYGKFPVIGSWDETCNTFQYEQRRRKVDEYHAQKKRIQTNMFDQRYSEYNIYVYGTPVSLVNPYFINKKAKKTKAIEEEKDKGEVSLLGKAVKTINQIKQSKSELTKLQKQKEILRGIRGDISKRMTEIKKYKEEQEEDPDKVEPEEVSEDIMAFYAQQKMEKKKLTNDREKEKSQKKKIRTFREPYSTF